MISLLAAAAVLIPAVWCLCLGALLLACPRWAGERALANVTSFFSLILIAAVLAVAWTARHALLDGTSVMVPLPDWFNAGGYAFELEILVDRLSIAFGLLSSFLFAVVMKFSFNYLHREPGYPRFFMLTSLLCLGLMTIAFAGDLDLLVTGWELVGLSSVLLIGFFRENPQTVRNSFRAFSVYRVCDIGLLCVAALLHHGLGTTSFAQVAPKLAAAGVADARFWAALLGSLTLFAALGKSAQLPFSSWLPRAMEGPTSSSAIYYGALSVHLGPFLLLRLSPFFEHSPALKIAVCATGLLTAFYARAVGRTRSDAKTALGYATIAQVGLIFCEIGLGWHKLALTHLVLHAGLRTWQFLGSVGLLQDFMDNPLVTTGRPLGTGWIRGPAWPKAYIHALNEFYLDAALSRLAVRPFLSFWKTALKFEAGLNQAANEGLRWWLNPRSRRAEGKS